jgi:hypothetical protein
LLERATRRFVHEEQYRSDIRLLKLWLLYAKYVDTPRDIFKFLEGLQVGVKLASFYEEWAMLEEQSNRCAPLRRRFPVPQTSAGPTALTDLYCGRTACPAQIRYTTSASPAALSLSSA